jgi:chromate transporter
VLRAGDESTVSDEPGAPSLVETALLFLRLGTTAFGGPAAHLAVMEDEVVRRRRWLSREQFLDYLGATNLIPGPNSTELAIHIGMARHGWPGLLVAGGCFILPSAVIVGAIASAYVRYGTLPQVAGVFHGITPVVIAIILAALWQLARTATKSAGLAVLGLGALVALLTGVHELVVLLVAGVVSPLLANAVPWRRRMAVLVAAAGGWGSSSGMAVAAGSLGPAASSLWALFLVFARIGAVLFGSGYVLIAFLRADVVERLGWLTERQLLDAVAVGQVTPGPLFTTATFVGYLVGGAAGAAVATVGIFLPAFVFVALSGPLVPRLRRSRVAGAVLDGVNVASLAMMAAVTLQLGSATLRAPLPVALAGLSLALLARYSINPTWLVAVGATAGWIFERSL